MSGLTDRELLELAAKAAGIIGVWHERGQCIHVTDCEGMSDIWWRPLTDDGDALRLAADLGLVICTDKRSVYAHTIPGITPSAYASQGGPDHMANICRAITRAAAEIGRAMS